MSDLKERWKSALKNPFYYCAWILAISIMMLGWQQAHRQAQTEQVRTVVDICPTTAYTWGDDVKRPGDKHYGYAFTGEKAIVGTCALDPKYWSERLQLAWDDKWSYEKKRSADVFWKVTILDIDNNVTYLPRDTGSAVKKKRIDISLGDLTPESKHVRDAFGKQYRRFIIIVNQLEDVHGDQGK